MAKASTTILGFATAIFLVTQYACSFDQDAGFFIGDFDSVEGIFNDVELFAFDIQFDDVEFKAGQTYSNPPLENIIYQVNGVLNEPTPSGFPQFFLSRQIAGPDFYSQGSSMEFEIRADAQVDDGIQISELVAGFVLNAREVDTGRYHPPLLELFTDGTGRMQNSNNTGGINPANGMKVDIDFGDEYIIDLTFDPAQLTIVDGFSLGDVNRDCVVDLLDVQPFVDALLAPELDFLADMNSDGSDDLLDVSLFIQELTGK